MAIVDAINGFLWGPPLLILVVGVGLIYTFLSGAFQFRYLGHILKNTFGKMLEKSDPNQKGILTSFQAVSSAIGGSVGVANISGVATAIVTGGPGAVFWIWVAALVGMLNKMVEVTLAVHYRKTDEKGDPYGGPTYYMQRALGEEKGFKLWYIPAFIFGVGIFLTYIFTLQNYTVSESIGNTFNIPLVYVSVAYMLICYAMIMGGIPWLGKVAGILVPFMCLFYIIAGMIVILKDVSTIPASFSLIFRSAFNPQAALGGTVGYGIIHVMRTGVGRCVYSNEAGWGTSPMIHATAKVDHPVKQGMWGVFEVFVDTIIVCTVTSLVVVNSGLWDSGLDGATLTLTAFEHSLGSTARIIIACSVFLFGISTTSGWYAYYEVLLRHLMGDSKMKQTILTIYRLSYPIPGMLLVWITVYTTMDTTMLWGIADITAGIPTFVNLLAIVFMAKRFLDLVKDYKARYLGIGEVDPNFKVFYEDQ